MYHYHARAGWADLLMIFVALMICLLLIAGIFGVFWYVYKTWINPQPLRATHHGIASAFVFGCSSAAYLWWISPTGQTDIPYLLILSMFFMLTFPMTQPLMHGCVTLWKRLTQT